MVLDGSDSQHNRPRTRSEEIDCEWDSESRGQVQQNDVTAASKRDVAIPHRALSNQDAQGLCLKEFDIQSKRIFIDRIKSTHVVAQAKNILKLDANQRHRVAEEIAPGFCR